MNYDNGVAYDSDNEYASDEEHYISDEIIDIEELVTQIEDDVYKIWRKIIKPYMSNHYTCNILFELNNTSPHPFTKFILNNNQQYKKLKKYLYELYAIQSMKKK